MNIQTKLFTGFAVVVVISAAMGVNAVRSIYDVSSLTNRLYEHPLMSISFARNAQSNFIKMNLSLNLALSSTDASEFENRLATAEEFEEEFGGDLEVVEERILNETGAAIVLELVGLLEQWAELRETIVEAGGPEMSSRTELSLLSLRKSELARLTEEKLDLLIEASALEGYLFIQSAKETNDFTLFVQLLAVLVAVTAGFLASLCLGRGIARPIIAMTAAMTKLADGDNEITVPAVGRKDEIGDMAAAVQVFKENAERTLAAEKALREAHDTLEQRVDERTAALETEITDRKRVEAALRESEEWHALTAAGANDGLWDWNTLTSESYFSLRWKQIRGFKDHELENVRQTFTDALHPDDKDRVTAAVRAHLDARVPYDIEFRLRHKDGHYVWVRSKGQAIWDEHGNPRRMAGSISDITDRKRAEEALRASEGALQERVVKLKEARRRLKRYAKELVRSNEELEQFAFVASHDLQEPLRKVQAFGDRLMKRYSDALGEDGQDYIARMQGAAGRMQTLIQSLLDFSRVATKGQPFIPVNLNELMKSILSDLEIPIQETGARVKVANLPTIDADPSQMRQLFQNLIGNALKYRQENVPPKIELASDFVSKESGTPKNRHGGLCQIKVIDNGIGFEEQYAERIFGIFQRLHGREQYEGTGVGLAIARKIAERHGGSISANGRPGEGATFTAILPVSHPTNERD